MAPPYDFLDSMAWDIVISAVLLAIAAIRLPYKASKNSVDEEGKNLRLGFAAAIGASGFYLFITGIAFSFIWPSSFGNYNILFGGIAGLSGLLLLATSATLFFNGGLRAVSYMAVIVGLYAVVDAAAMVIARLTKSPELSALSYLSFAAAAFLSVPATHSDNKKLRWLFAVFAFLFAIAWLYEAANFTLGHLGAI